MLADLIAESEKFDEEKADYVAPAITFSWNDQARLVPPDCMGLTTQPLQMTENALRQVCSKLGPVHFGKGSNRSLPFDFLQAAAPDFRASMLNRVKQSCNGSKWMARAYQDTCRAVVNGDYPGGATAEGYENTVFLKALNELASKSKAAANGDFHLFRSAVTPDHLIARASWKTLPDPLDPNQHWGLGCLISNDETGNGGAKVYAAIKRASCDNTFALDTSQYPGVDIVHRGSYAALRAKIKDGIGTVLKVDAIVMETIWEAEEEQIPEIDDVLQGLALEHHWTRELSTVVARGTEGNSTRMGIVNGLTWAAQHGELQDDTDRMVMELFAGRLLFAPRQEFAELANRAKRERAGLVGQYRAIGQGG